ncbi:hypothetical protein AO826_19225 [Xanthomonas phaseoli pv. manihotis]|nr:hypothetical protein AO826_19225 [Xanthomonas phaseoli pv. manihotis]
MATRRSRPSVSTKGQAWSLTTLRKIGSPLAGSVQVRTAKLCQQSKQIEAAIKIRIEGVGHVLVNAKASCMLLGDPAFNMGLAELMFLVVQR